MSVRRMRSLYVVAAAWVLLAAAPPSQVTTRADESGRLTVPVLVNGRGPYQFLIDTGADHTVVSLELAAELKLPTGRQVTIHDILGASAVNTVRIDRLSFGGHEMEDVQAPVLAAAGLGAPGMLGTDGLRNARVVLDIRNRTLRVDPVAPDPVSGGDVVVVEGVRRYGHLVLVDAETQEQPVFVILDTGAQDTIGNDALRRLLAIPRKLQPVQIMSVTGHITQASPSLIPELRLGSVQVRTMPIAYADLHTFAEFHLQNRPAMLLGMDVLGNFRSVTIDFRRSRVTFVVP